MGKYLVIKLPFPYNSVTLYYKKYSANSISCWPQYKTSSSYFIESCRLFILFLAAIISAASTGKQEYTKNTGNNTGNNTILFLIVIKTLVEPAETEIPCLLQ